MANKLMHQTDHAKQKQQQFQFKRRLAHQKLFSVRCEDKTNNIRLTVSRQIESRSASERSMNRN